MNLLQRDIYQLFTKVQGISFGCLSKCSFNISAVHQNKKDGSASNISYCADLVRKHDYEMFLCTLLIPDPTTRTKVMAVRSFNTEIALIRDQVSHKDIGLARLAFWREAINQLYQAKKSGGGGTVDLSQIHRQPTILELSRVIMEDNVSKKWFTNLLDGREKMMADAPFGDMGDLESYSDQTISSLLYLTFEILGLKNMEIDHAASHLGKAIGISTFIRSIPHNAQNRRVLIPKDLMMKHRISQEDLIRNKKNEKVKELVFEVASQAHMHYEKAKSLKNSIDKQALPTFIVGVPSGIYLKRLQQVAFDPYHPSLTRRYGLLPWHLYYKKLTKSY